MRATIFAVVALLFSDVAFAEENFVTIHKVDGQKMLVSKSAGRGRGRGGAQAGARGRRGRRTDSDRSTVVVVPRNTKITTAQRARRTGEIQVGIELAGGLEHRVFKALGSGLQARIITGEANNIKEINVFTDVSDINQSNSVDGRTVIAIRPKRPPMKKK